MQRTQVPIGQTIGRGVDGSYILWALIAFIKVRRSVDHHRQREYSLTYHLTSGQFSILCLNTTIPSITPSLILV